MIKFENINIPKNIKVSFVYIKNLKFIVLNNSINTKYICIPNFIIVGKDNEFLTLSYMSTDDKSIKDQFNQFVERFEFVLKNLSTIFKKKLILKGLGYKFNVQESLRNIELKLGFSHLINVKIPDNVKVKLQKNYINIESNDNVLLGNFVNKIVSLKLPDSYKGKGFWYKYQKITLKTVKKK